MSENESFTITDLMKTLVIISKNVKALSELVKTIDEKINQPKSNNEDDKDKMDNIFEKKGLGRPVGDYETKRKKYCEMVNSNKIKMPKSETIEYYKLFKNEEGKYELVE